MKKLLLLCIIAMMTIPVMAQSPSGSTNNPMSRKDSLTLGYLMRISQHTAPAYKLYPTENMWTFLELETFTGKIWQVQYSVSGDRFKVPINSVDLSFDFTGDLQYAGRFELYSTQNMYNFLLLDRENGQVWQVQWSLDADKRGLVGAINSIE